MEKHWVNQVRSRFKQSREPIPHEVNELDWKSNLSEKSERLAEHLIAFSNHPGGGFLVFGVTEPNAKLIGIKQEDATYIVNKLTNLARDAIQPPLMILINLTALQESVFELSVIKVIIKSTQLMN